MPEAYFKEVTLPSKGVYYGDKIPDGIVSVEPMGTKEEKLFASSRANGSMIIDKIISGCSKLPIPAEELVLGDRLFLLLQIRSVTYGNMYEFPFRCSECRAKSWSSIDIDQIPIKHPKEESKILFEVELPIKKIKLTIRIPTGKDENKVKQYVDQLNSKTRGSGDDAAYVYRIARRIEMIDEKAIGIKEAMELVNELRGADSLAIRDAIEDNEVGPNLEVAPTCNACGYENDSMLIPFETEFFRPRKRRSSDGFDIRAAENVDATR